MDDLFNRYIVSWRKIILNWFGTKLFPKIIPALGNRLIKAK